MIPRLVALALVLASLVGTAPVWAQDLLRAPADGLGDAQASTGETLQLSQPQGDQPRVLDAIAAGEAMSLKQVLAGLRPGYPGQVLDAQLFEREGRWLYRIKLLGPDGKVQVLTVDARTGAVVEQR